MKNPDYTISTPENVDLHLELAGLGSRIWAAFVDMTLIYLVLLVILAAALGFSAGLQQSELPQDTKTVIYYYVIAISIFIAFCLQFGYFIVFEKLWKGQTPGKRLVQIRVIETNGQPVNWSSVIIRNLIRIIDANLLMVGVVVMLFDKNERRLGDFLGGTLVIRERQPLLSSKNLKIQAEAPASSFVDAGQITTDDYYLLVNFLRRRQKMNPTSRTLLAKDLEEYFRSKLNPEYKGESAENLLEKLYLAYTARAQLENS